MDQLNIVTKHKLKDPLNVDGEINNYKCETCGKKFSGAGRLNRHIRNVHEGEKFHKCEFCEKTFYQQGNLMMKHIAKIHKKHKCELCEKEFSTRKTLRNHINHSMCSNV